MFNDWLLQRLKESDWSQADLARSSGLTTAAISKYMSGRIPDEAALRKIAKAFRIPLETVFRAAGILPPEAASDVIVDEITHIARQLPSSDVQELIEIARLKLTRHERTKNINPKTQPAR
jgi:transcriptional regulator with XRE-family HTH domain